jgi:hypothetical protein
LLGRGFASFFPEPSEPFALLALPSEDPPEPSLPEETLSEEESFDVESFDEESLEEEAPSSAAAAVSRWRLRVP